MMIKMDDEETRGVRAVIVDRCYGDVARVVRSTTGSIAINKTLPDAGFQIRSPLQTSVHQPGSTRKFPA